MRSAERKLYSATSVVVGCSSLYLSLHGEDVAFTTLGLFATLVCWWRAKELQV